MSKGHMYWVRSAIEVADKYGTDNPFFKEYKQKALQAAYELEAKEMSSGAADEKESPGYVSMVRGLLDDAYADRCKVVKKKTRAAYASVDYNAVQKAYDAGKVDWQIAEFAHTSRTTVVTWRTKHGLPSNMIQKPYKHDDVLRKAYAKGLNDTEASATTGISYYAIRDWRRRNNLPSNYTLNRRKGNTAMG